MTKEKCIWTANNGDYDSDMWETSCGEAFVLLEGTLKENKMNFCCYCGKPLKAKP